ncbi:effector binding domain-containing protein [Thiomicrorhabdus sp.]|uniref:GyrI-like domain-containing protein n=1 Tax=Thiomicrorhabdus sp. TaxID=2039724 RepID=UPI0029C7C30F|nr:effector binding domain-containing protein [Thiomicrorhabdus sp.]
MIEKRNAVELIGMKLRTNNADEMDPAKAGIGGLWQAFYDRAGSVLPSGAAVYGVYFNYESDMNGDFDVAVCADASSALQFAGAEPIAIREGEYAVFRAKGEMPQTVINLWVEIWEYFQSGKSPYLRAYTTDFERYFGDDEVEICIAVK